VRLHFDPRVRPKFHGPTITSDPHSAPFSGFLSIFFSTRALWMIYLQKRVFDYHECSV
jgi:hypothetical protein